MPEAFGASGPEEGRSQDRLKQHENYANLLRVPPHQHAAVLAAVRLIASRQRMLVTTRQLAAAGMGEHARRHAVIEGDLQRRRRGVYGLPGGGTQWEDEVMVAVLAGGGGTVASGAAAARLWGLSQSDRSGASPPNPAPANPGRRPSGSGVLTVIEVTSPRLLRIPGVQAHVQALPPSEVTRRFGVPVTTASRTLLDLSARLDHDAMGALVDEALRQRIVSLRELGRTADARIDSQARARHGSPQLCRIIDERRGLPGPGANAWEERMDREWDRMGLPPAARQHWVHTPQGSYCVDRAIVELMIAVEWNGFEYHGRRSRFDYDSQRRGHLLAAGWLVLDFTSRSTPEHIVRTVRGAVTQRKRTFQH